MRDPIRHCHTSNHRAVSCTDDAIEGFESGTYDDSDCDSDVDDDSSSCSTAPLHFQCSNLLLGKSNRATNTNATLHEGATQLSAASHNSLSGGILASCHLDGSAKLWDLSTRRCIVQDICQEKSYVGSKFGGSRRLGAGLALRRLSTGWYQENSHGSHDDAAHQFLYQSRDPFGTVTLHDSHRPCTPLSQIQTHSSSFCAISPCRMESTIESNNTLGGAQHLVAFPTQEQSVAVVRDLRCDPTGAPAWMVSVGNEYRGWHEYSKNSHQNYGMLMSLALCMQERTQNIVLGCGMEDGSVLFHDLGAIGHGRKPWRIDSGKIEQNAGIDLPLAQDFDQQFNNFDDGEQSTNFVCRAKLGKDPVLCLDLASSKQQHQSVDVSNSVKNGQKSEGDRASARASLLAVSGCAGDADEMAELPDQDHGTVSTIKVSLADESSQDLHSASMKATVRAKTQTCSLAAGKIGVASCRFRPDGRMFAVGGWDHRLRIFGRTTSQPLAILHGHEESVTAVDWAESAAVSGLLATGAGDGRICIYRVFPHSLRTERNQIKM